MSFMQLSKTLILEGSQKEQNPRRTSPEKALKNIFRSFAANKKMEFFTTSGSATNEESVFNNTIIPMTFTNGLSQTPSSVEATPRSSRYENQKRRDWNTFCQYLRNHRPPLSGSLCSGAHVLEFLRYLDQFGKTKVHNQTCPFFGIPNPPGPCPCPLRQAWGSLDALIGRLRAAFEENGGKPEANPFAARAVRLFLREVRDFQSKSRGISYEKKRKRTSKQKVVALQTDATATNKSSITYN